MNRREGWIGLRFDVDLRSTLSIEWAVDWFYLGHGTSLTLVD